MQPKRIPVYERKHDDFRNKTDSSLPTGYRYVFVPVSPTHQDEVLCHGEDQHQESGTNKSKPNFPFVDAFVNSTLEVVVHWRYVLDPRSTAPKPLSSFNNTQSAVRTSWDSSTTVFDSTSILKALKSNGPSNETNFLLDTKTIPPLYCLNGGRLMSDDIGDFNPKSSLLNPEEYRYTFRLHELFWSDRVTKNEIDTLVVSLGARTLDLVDSNSTPGKSKANVRHTEEEWEALKKQCRNENKTRQKIHKTFCSDYETAVSSDPEYQRHLTALNAHLTQSSLGNDSEDFLNTVKRFIQIYFYYTKSCYFSHGFCTNTPLDLASEIGLDCDILAQDCLTFLFYILEQCDNNNNVKATDVVESSPGIIVHKQVGKQNQKSPALTKAAKKNDTSAIAAITSDNLSTDHDVYVSLTSSFGKTQYGDDMALSLIHLRILYAQWTDNDETLYRMDSIVVSPLLKLSSTTQEKNEDRELSSIKNVLNDLLESVFVKVILKRAFLIYIRNNHFASPGVNTTEAFNSKNSTTLTLSSRKPSWVTSCAEIKHRVADRQTPDSSSSFTDVILAEEDDARLVLGDACLNAPIPHTVRPFLLTNDSVVALDVGDGMSRRVTKSALSRYTERLKRVLESNSFVPHILDSSLSAASIDLKTEVREFIRAKVTEPELMKQIKLLRTSLKNKQVDMTLTLRNAQKMACVIYTNALKWSLEGISAFPHITHSNNVLGRSKKQHHTLLVDFIVQLQPCFKKNMLLAYELALIEKLNLPPIVTPAPKEAPKKTLSAVTAELKKSARADTEVSRKKQSQQKLKQTALTASEEETDGEDSSAYDSSELESSFDSVSVSDSEDVSFDIGDCGDDAADDDDGDSDVEVVNEDDDDDVTIVCSKTSLAKKHLQLDVDDTSNDIDVEIEYASSLDDEEDREAERRKRRRDKAKAKRAIITVTEAEAAKEQRESNINNQSTRGHLKRYVAPISRYMPSMDDDFDNKRILRETKETLERRKQINASISKHNSELPELIEPPCLIAKKPRTMMLSKVKTPKKITSLLSLLQSPVVVSSEGTPESDSDSILISPAAETPSKKRKVVMVATEEEVIDEKPTKKLKTFDMSFIATTPKTDEGLGVAVDKRTTKPNTLFKFTDQTEKTKGKKK